jgi:predicted dehydrogenase
VAQHGEEPFITAEDGRRAQIIAEAALRSARDGRPVAISY